MIHALRVRLLGRVTASLNGHDLDLGPPRQRTLFATLAARAGEPVSRKELVDAIWGMDAPPTVESSVYTYVARLRRGLEPDRASRAPSGLLLNDGSGYLLNLTPGNVDAARFEQRLEEARRLRRAGAPAEALAELEEALALWHGTAFGGAAGPFADAERVRLGELRFTAVEDRAEVLLALDRHPEVIGELSGLVKRHPLRERLRHLLMRAYYRSGRQADALAEFRDVRTLLVRELGLEPGDELRRCHELILRGDPLRQTVNVLGSAPAQLPRDVPAFTGREEELRRLRAYASEAEAGGETGLILIDGGPGVGKTALAVRLAHELAARYPDGQLHVDLRGFSGAPPLSATEALRQLLGETPADPGSYRSLMAGRRLLVLLDNAESAEQVRPLLAGTRSCLMIVTSRNRLSGLVARDGARRLTLGAMPDGDAAELMRRIMGEPGRPALVEACAGLPVALRIAAERVLMGALNEFSGPDDLLKVLHADDDDPSSVRTLFSWSYRALPRYAQQMFHALGRHAEREVSLDTAARAAGLLVEQAGLALDRLASAHLVEKAGRDRFRLHGLMHAYAKELATNKPRPEGPPSR
ncbi:BTAD domain-containing putative transcriptional regulator [Nonomuraea sp. 10N515B]|uniref:BTAD domain-containing putative transcriptional regulator n=1 Tax=Nonomuraea sp. 10N515B TaxID=3457422 RepID=UPI003FCE1FF1